MVDAREPRTVSIVSPGTSTELSQMVVVGSLITWSGAAGILGVVEEVEGQRRVVVLFDDGERRRLTIETVESKLYSNRRPGTNRRQPARFRAKLQRT